MKVVSVAPRSSRFSSCSLPRLRSQPDPLPLPVVPDAPAVEQQEAVPAGGRSVAAIQPRDRRGGGVEQRVVACDGLGRGVRPVRQQREVKLAVRAREVVDLQPLDLLFQSSAGVVSSVGTATRCAGAAGTPSRSSRPGRIVAPNGSGDAAVDQRHRRIDRRDQPEQRRARRATSRRSPASASTSERQREHDRGDRHDAADIAADARSLALKRPGQLRSGARKPTVASNARRPPAIRW